MSKKKSNKVDRRLVEVPSQQVRSNIQLAKDKDQYLFEFAYDEELVWIIKKIWPARKWDRLKRVWLVKAKSVKDAESVLGFAKRFDFVVGQNVRKALLAKIENKRARSRLPVEGVSFDDRQVNMGFE
jgi:DNA-binding TFAR19-related protein (PDSD5 family)